MISIIPYSKNAALINWEGPIHKKTISEVNIFNKLIQSSGVSHFTETIPAFTSITVCYNDADFSTIKSILEKQYSQLHNQIEDNEVRQWRLPIFPADNLNDAVSDHFKMNSDTFYQSLFDIKFTIGMKGFLPGFIYLAGLPESMHIPRKTIPDRSIPKGSVAIGGSQCGIYPKESPGGWHVIGNCPIPLLDLEDENLSCFQVGDEIQFVPINADQKKDYENMDWTLEKITSEFGIS